MPITLPMKVQTIYLKTMTKLSVLLIISLLAFCRCNRQPERELPAFNLLLLDSTTVVNTGNIQPGKPVLIIFFHTDCEYCQRETEAIINNMNKLQNVRFYLVSIDPLSDIRFYRNYYHLGKFKNIVIGRDTGWYLPDHYPIKSTPYMQLYDKEDRLRGIMTGAIQMDTLLEKIKEL
ncbi:MAG: redoxin domain-containing protein [Chitinophagaceae bacterium]|nr:MAG: redoxin domain-containing protein [Chitinophagaceae bacterium]